MEIIFNHEILQQIAMIDLKEMEINLVKTMAKCDILGLSEKFKIYQTELLS